MHTRVVLGFPYAGALHCLLNSQGRWGHLNAFGREAFSHSDLWLRACFGEDPHRHVQETVSMALLFDEIYLTPTGDNLFVAGQEFGELYANRSLGIFAHDEWYEESSTRIERELRNLHRDAEVQRLLGGTEPNLQWVTLRHALNQVYVAQKFDAAICASSPYLALCRRLDVLVSQRLSTMKTQNSATPQHALENVFKAMSLQFSVSGVEEFALLREDKNIRAYSREFRKHIATLPDGNTNEEALYRAMLNAMHSDSVGQKIAGGFEMIAQLASLGSFIPVLGFALGLLGLAAEAGAATAKRKSRLSQWWLLAPEIAKRLSKRRVEQLYKEVIERRG